MMNPSSYDAPAQRPFAGFLQDLTPAQQKRRRETLLILRKWQYEDDRANILAEVLGNIIAYGGVFQPTREQSVAYNVGQYIPHWKEANPSLQSDEGLSVWYEPEERLFKVLEWNRVRGVVVRSYAPMTFIKKLYKHYIFGGQYDTSCCPDSFQPFIDMIFPDINAMEVQVWDQPSLMYEYRNIASCMVGTEYVKFYDTAPCKGLVVMADGKMVTRCILWTLDDGRRIIGRIYDSTGAGSRLIKRWCKENGVLTNWDGRYQVTAPVSEYGVPYQDNFWYGVRQGDKVVLFNTGFAAEEYCTQHKVYGNRYYDLCHTMGGEDVLRLPMVKCVDGSEALEHDTIYHNGHWYNRNNLVRPNIYNLGRLPLDQMVLHPNKLSGVIKAGELEVVNGEVVVRSQCITLADGRLAHPQQVFYALTVRDGKMYVDRSAPVLNVPDGYGKVVNFHQRWAVQAELDALGECHVRLDQLVFEFTQDNDILNALAKYKGKVI